MANFCAQCGSPLTPNTAFCTACGTAVAPPAAAPDAGWSTPEPIQYDTLPSVEVPVTPAYATVEAAPIPAFTPAPTPVAASPFPSSNIQPEPAPRGSAQAPAAGQYAPVPSSPFPSSNIQPEPPRRGSSQAAATPGQYAPVQAAPAYGSGPVQGGSSSPVLKIILFVIAGIIFMVLLIGSFIGYKIYNAAKSVRQAIQTDGNGQTSITTPSGIFSAGSGSGVTEEELGVPLYPGATTGKGGVHLKNKGGSFLTVVYKTDADPETVAEFYRSKLPKAEETTSSFNHVTVFKIGSDNDHTMISVTPKSGSDTNKTDIVIMRTQTEAQQP